MISLAKEKDFLVNDNDECLVRIRGLYLAYGFVPFIQYYTDGNGALLSIMDGVATFYSNNITDEWVVFLTMNPNIAIIHCSAANGRILIDTENWQGREGEVMSAINLTASCDATVNTSPSLSQVHQFLSVHFPNMSPFNYWYPDVSHRIRHKCGHIASITSGDDILSCALTVAETENSAILGQIATSPQYRRQGLAGKCINTLSAICKGKKLYILPLNENAKKLYSKLGFEVTGGWAELERTH